MLDLKYPIQQIKPADYNPRSISSGAFDTLRASIRALGMIRPIIVTASGRLIAGHQRCKAMVAEGFDSAPAHVLGDVSPDDEIRFNQLHNASDKEITDARLRIPAQKRTGWIECSADELIVEHRPMIASKLNEILRLLAKHGPFSGAVALSDGRIVAGQLYAFACKLVGATIHLYIVPRGQADTVSNFLAKDYGVFSYAHLPKTTWAQSLAQMYRIRSGRSERGRSRTYEEFVIPHLTRSMRVLDFGAGQMDYVRYLHARRFNIIGVEFYRRRPGEMTLDLPAIHADIDRLAQDLRQHGLFDVVICDSVLNSVDSMQAEADVLTTINALCRSGGTIIFSGRRRAFEEGVEHRLKHSRSCVQRHVYFTDDNGLTAMHQRGVWLYQKFHRDDEVRELATSTIGPDFESRFRTSAWAVRGTKAVERDGAIAALTREFDLPLPDGSRFGRSDVVDAWKVAVSRARTSRAARTFQTRMARRNRGSKVRACAEARRKRAPSAKARGTRARGSRPVFSG